MSSNSEQMPPVDDLHRLIKWVDERDARSGRTNNDGQGRETIITERQISLLKTLGFGVLTSLLAVGVTTGFIAAPGFFAGAKSAAESVIKNQIQAKSGQAKVESLNFVMPPFTMTTVESKSVVGVDLNTVAVDSNANKAGTQVHQLPLPPNQSLKRQNIMSTKFNITLDETNESYDINKKTLTYFVSNTAISVEEIINTDSKESQKDLPVVTNLYQDIIKNALDVGGSATHIIADLKNLVSDKDKQITASEVPLIGQLANGSITPTTALEKVADIYAKQAMNSTCVPEIAKQDIFSKEFSKNVVNIGRLNLFGDSASHKKLVNNLSSLMALPEAERNKIIANAKVVLAPNFANTITTDPSLTASIDNYTTLGLFSKKGATFKCDISSFTAIGSDGKVIK